jgi:alanine dehydrogenase
MLIGIPKEIKDQEYRVAMTPGGIKSLTEAGHRVLVQEGAGKGSGLADAEYTAAGASVISELQAIWEADMIVKVKEPQPDEFELMRPDRILFTFLHLAAEESLTMEMLKRRITGIGYETVELESGELPLLKPMSEIAGRVAVQVGAHYLEKKNGGKGKLISGVPGVEPARVVIIGSGTVGSNAARIAVGMGAEVILISTFIDQLRKLEDIIQGRFLTLSADPFQIAGAVAQADLLIGAVLVPGARTPKVVSREMVASMKAGSVIVDVAVDQGGCIETTRPTTHSDPVYDVNGVIHYAVTNIPGAVPATSTQALANATLPYIRKLADGGLDFLKKDRALLKGVNTYQGHLTYRAVADALGIQYTPFVS